MASTHPRESLSASATATGYDDNDDEDHEHEHASDNNSNNPNIDRAEDEESMRFGKYMKGFVMMDELYQVSVRIGHRSRMYNALLLELFFIAVFLPYMFLQSDYFVRYDINTYLKQQLLYQQFQVPSSSSDHILYHSEDGMDVPIDFMQIQSSNQYWSWVNDVLYPIVYHTEDGSNITNRIGKNNYVLWGIRFRQVRVERFPDCVSQLLPGISCYPPFQEQWEATASGFYGPIYACPTNNSCDQSEMRVVTYLYNWQSQPVLGAQPYTGKFGTYPGSGFPVVLPLIPESARNRINQMIDPATAYIDLQTRIVFVTFTVFNPNTNSLSYVEAIVEQSASGSWAPSFSVQSAVFWHTPTVAALIGVFLFLSHLTMAWFVLKFTMKLFDSHATRNDTLWTLVDSASVGLYIFSIIRAFIFYSGVTDTFFVELGHSMVDFSNQNNNSFTYIQDGSPYFFSGAAEELSRYRLAQTVYGWIVILSSARLARCLSSWLEFDAINRTLYSSIVSITVYCAFACFMLVAYAFAATISLGLTFDEYRSLGSSFLLLLTYFGFGIDHAGIFGGGGSAAKTFLPVFLVMFAVMFLFILFPIFLGILYTSWIITAGSMKVEAEERDRKAKTHARHGGRKSRRKEISPIRRMFCCCCAESSRSAQAELESHAMRVVEKKPEENEACASLVFRWIQNLMVFFGYPRQGWIPDTLVAPRLLSWYRQNNLGPILSFEQIRLALTGKRTEPYHGRVETRQIVYLLLLCDVDKLITEDELKEHGVEVSDFQRGRTINNEGNDILGPDEATIKRLEMLINNLEFEDRMKAAHLQTRIRTLAINQSRLIRLLDSLEN